MIIDELFEAPQQCPECGGISFSDLILAEKKDACYHKVKASAKVWPSAYASGRLVQCRKKGAANYGNKSESVAEGWGVTGGTLGFIGGVLLGSTYFPGSPISTGIVTLSTALGAWVGSKFKDIGQDAREKYELESSFLVFVNGKQISANKVNYREAAQQISKMAEKEHDPNTFYTIYDASADKIVWRFKITDDDVDESVEQGMAEGQLELNTPDPVVVVQDLKGNILDKINLSVAAQKYKLGQPQNIKNQLAHQNYTKVGNYTIVSPMSGQPQDATTQGVAETELDEKSVSQAQFRTMAGAAHNPEFARKVGISQDVAQEFNQADKHSNYKKLPDRATEGEQQKGADYRDPKEVDYDDEYDAMVARVKKLAGLGPMKTTYDPAKRVYRNMPTAVQPKK